MHRGGPELAGGGLPWPNKAQMLLLHAAIGPEENVRAMFDAWCSIHDIEAPVDGGTYRLLPLLYARLFNLGIDVPLMGRLKGIYRRAWYENNLLFHRAMPAVVALQAAGIDTMLFKGMPIALSYHANHATRPMADLDIVVRPNQVGAALEVLAELGWKVTAKPLQQQPDLHAQDLCNAEGNVIDLHWHCLREAPGEKINEWFWSSARPFTFQGVETLQPAATQMLVHTMLHGVRSNLEPSIRWVSDAATLMAQTSDPIDWSDVVAFARQHRLTCRMSMALKYLAEEFEQPVPKWVIRQLDAAGISIIERIENIGYLGPADGMQSSRLYPLIDYWRFRRVLGAASFWSRFPSYLTRRWQLYDKFLTPVATASRLLRHTRRGNR